METTEMTVPEYGEDPTFDTLFEVLADCRTALVARKALKATFGDQDLGGFGVEDVDDDHVEIYVDTLDAEGMPVTGYTVRITLQASIIKTRDY